MKDDDDIYYHAINYRTASVENAHEMWKALESCINRTVNKELTDHINKVWADTYAGAEPVSTLFALKARVTNLAEDRNCWLFNAKVANNKLNELEKTNVSNRS